MEKEESYQRRKNKALKISLKEGISSNVSTNVGDSYMIPFALALNATSTQVGILSSFSTFLYHISQLFGAKMLGRYSRKKLVLYFVFLQALMWLFVSAIAIAVWKGLFDGYSVWLLIVFYSILMAFGGISKPAWFSWLGDLIPGDKRGTYLGKRNRIISAIGIVTALLAAFFLDYFKTKGYVLLAFSILFAIAFSAKFISYRFLKKQWNPRYKQKKKDYFSLIEFIKRFDNFGKFAVYQGFFHFALMLASPFFVVYMLKELNFSYITYMLALVSYTLFYLIFLPLVGKFSDKYGNRKLLTISNFFYVLTPLLFIVFKNPIWIITLPQLTAGIASAASVISFSNFIYDSVSPKHRALCAAYTNILIGIGALLGALIGGLIIDRFHPATMNPYIFVFLVAMVSRFLVAAILLPEIKEVRKVKRTPRRYSIFTIPTNIMHAGGVRLIHLPERILGKFKSLGSFHV